MAKKVSKKPNRSGRPLYAYIDEAIYQALEQMVASHRPTVTITAVAEDALREYLTARGYLPTEPPVDD